MTFTVFTGDKRFDYLCDLIENDGHTVFKNRIDGINKSNSIILPFPINRTTAPYLDEIMSPVINGKTVFAGLIDDDIKTAFENMGASVFDYMKNNTLTAQNASFTVEGALALCVCSSDKAIFRSNCLVSGYGKIAKRLCDTLRSLQANVTVAVRRADVIKDIQRQGFNAVLIDNLCSIQEFDYIFNTVPAVIFDKQVISTLQDDCVVIELASKPGGFDLSANDEYGIKIVNGAGLPGKYSPFSCAKTIYQTILSYL